MSQTAPIHWSHPRWILGRIPFVLMHLMPLGVFWVGFGWKEFVLCIGLYVMRMFFITAGFHRYFAHRTFNTSRVMQFVLAFGAQMAAQRGALWWAAHHRDHHRWSDQEQDIHSPLRGFLYSHIGWIVDPKNHATRFERIKDFAKFPELRWLNRWHIVPAAVLGVAVYLLGGPKALFGGFFLSTVILYHGTFTINSLSHLWGTRRFETGDTSRNNFLLALITMGEGWHNNHHHLPGLARQGLKWWEIDLTYYGLRGLQSLGLIWDLREPQPGAV